MIINIEHFQLDELKAFLRIQADDAFPDLKDEQRLNMLAEKWHNYAEFCTCRNGQNQLIGIIVFYANQPDSKEAYLPHIYVSAHFRKRGLFTKMLLVVEKYVSKKGYNIIKLEVGCNRANAIESYIRNGLTIYECKQDRLYLKKQLDNK